MTFDFHATYDELNPDDHDYRFYAQLAADRGVRTAVDLGCGTGTLAQILTAQGVDVIGVDPDPEMLRVARSKHTESASGGRVEWRLGYSDVLEAADADLAVMWGHVAQVFTDDDSWLSVLTDLHRALGRDRTLAFESRSPVARKWEESTRAATLRTVRTPDGDVEFWHETVTVDLPLVTYDTFTRNLRTQEQYAHRDVLAFRNESELRTSVEKCGFTVTSVFGDWDRSTTDQQTPELIVIAARN
ncbi:class I SAM-dependent methyltransferase [Nocardioidaceae bacterium SCSIO 66511]|nr:class I SAM-dependent methyltransferase [Nocardioidaceae bacterium SCSIO 66511]